MRSMRGRLPASNAASAHRLAAALPAAFVPNAVGTSFTLAGSAA